MRGVEGMEVGMDWQRERLLEALESYRRGQSDAPHIVKWSGAGVMERPFDPSTKLPSTSLRASGVEALRPFDELRANGLEQQDEGGAMTFVASTEDVDRHGDVIAVSGWRLEAYRKNPVFLWAHDYARPAIGRATEVWTTTSSKGNGSGQALMVRVEFAPTDFAREVSSLYQDGYQKGVSVGFRPIRYEERRHHKTGEFLGIRFTEQELLEVSAAPVPANENALRKALGESPRLRGYFEGLLAEPLVELDEVLQVLREAMA